MKIIKLVIKRGYSIQTEMFLIAFVLLVNSWSAVSIANATDTKTVLVGSTPGDLPIKSMLTINPETEIDFIRWELVLDEADKKFDLKLHFGVNKPNTKDFMNDGERLSFAGVYEVSKNPKGNIYKLKSGKSEISFVKISENVFHLLTSENNLMIGNGGWSYSLNRKELSKNDSSVLVSQKTLDETLKEMTFEGRTPCQEFSKLYRWQAPSDCFKVKWGLALYRDADNQPTKYLLFRTLNRRNVIEGKWKTIKEKSENGEAIIYQLDPDKPDESIYLLVGDGNVLFFLDKEKRLLKGDADFSFTLNRREKPLPIVKTQ